MKLYRTFATPVGLDKTPATWTTSEAKAASERAKLVKAGYRRDDVTTKEVDVPTKRDELVAWLNENAK